MNVHGIEKVSDFLVRRDSFRAQTPIRVTINGTYEFALNDQQARLIAFELNKRMRVKDGA